MVSDVSLSCSLDFEVGQLLLHAMKCYALGVLGSVAFVCVFLHCCYFIVQLHASSGVWSLIVFLVFPWHGCVQGSCMCLWRRCLRMCDSFRAWLNLFMQPSQSHREETNSFLSLTCRHMESNNS